MILLILLSRSSYWSWSITYTRIMLDRAYVEATSYQSALEQEHPTSYSCLSSLRSMVSLWWSPSSPIWVVHETYWIARACSSDSQGKQNEYLSASDQAVSEALSRTSSGHLPGSFERCAARIPPHLPRGNITCTPLYFFAWIDYQGSWDGGEHITIRGGSYVWGRSQLWEKKGLSPGLPTGEALL